jgi:hypothetical protein
MGLQPAGTIHNNTVGDVHHLLFFHIQPRTHNKCGPFAIKRSDTLTSLKHMPFNTNHLYQFITPHSTLNATQLTKPPTKHVKITPFSLPIYSTLKFRYVIEYDRRPHSDTQREWNVHEVTKCSQLHYVTCNTWQTHSWSYGVLNHRF